MRNILFIVLLMIMANANAQRDMLADMATILFLQEEFASAEGAASGQGSASSLESDSIIRGSKQYELTNHLGNVLATISDKRIQATTAPQGTSGITADLKTASDFYPFGMLMPRRSFLSHAYVYGYQGSLKDRDILNSEDIYSTFFRELDTRICRWLSIDPKTLNTPWESPYVSMNNNPIWNNDPLGDKTSDERRIARANRKFTRKILNPLRSMNANGANPAAMQNFADTKMKKYQNRRWMKDVTLLGDRTNTGCLKDNHLSKNKTSSYKSATTQNERGLTLKLIVMNSPPAVVLPINNNRPANGNLTNNANTGVNVNPGDLVNVQFNPLGVANSLVVSTTTVIATTGGMISDINDAIGVYIFNQNININNTNSGVINYSVANTSPNAQNDNWQILIRITPAPIFNPRLLYSVTK